MSKLPSLKQYIIEAFIPEGESVEISDDLNLLESGILDSLAVLQLVAFIEDHYDIMLDPEQIDPDNLNSISAVSALIESAKSKAIS